MRSAEVEALGAVQAAYERWVDVYRRLDDEMAAASAQQAGLPVAALCADFDAQLGVTHAAINFAAACPEDGPDLQGLVGPAFVLALYQAVMEEPDLADELVALIREWDAWIAAARQWTPANDHSLPPRPASAAHSKVLHAVDSFNEFLMDRMTDSVVESLAAGADSVTTTVGTGPHGGEVVRHSIEFKPRSDRKPDPVAPGNDTPRPARV